MLFTIYLPRLAGPCQRWLAGGGRAAAEPPSPGRSHGDTDGDSTPRADHAAGTEAGGHELAREARALRPASLPQRQSPSPFVFLAAAGSRSAPCPSAVGTNQPFYATSQRSIPGASAVRAASRSGARPAPPLPTSGRELPHHPVPVPGTFGVQPGTPRGSRSPHTVFLRRLPPCNVFLLPPRRSPCSRASRRLGDVPVTVLAAVPPAPRAGAEHRRGRAGSPPARSSSSGFPRGAGAAPRLCPRLSCK